jgi:hypothetical protein
MQLNLELKTWSKQRLGYLPLIVMLPSDNNYSSTCPDTLALRPLSSVHTGEVFGDFLAKVYVKAVMPKKQRQMQLLLWFLRVLPSAILSAFHHYKLNFQNFRSKGLDK